MAMSAAFNQSVAIAVANDPDLLAKDPGPKVRLTTNTFTPDDTQLVGDFTFATFTGNAAKVLTAGPQNVIRDEVSGRWGIMLAEPVGGLNFICTADPVAEEVITGYVIVDNAGAILIKCERLPENVSIKKAGDYVSLEAIFGFLPVETFTELEPA